VSAAAGCVGCWRSAGPPKKLVNQHGGGALITYEINSINYRL
jgi:hypothetical protein